MRPETGPPAQTEHHHGSHRHLAVETRLEPARSARVDAIVVPTIRHPRWLEHAINLATDLDCPLVTLHSGNWSGAALASAAMPAEVRYVMIDIGEVDRLNLPYFATTALLKGTLFERGTDLAPKRNLGLLLARLMNWRRIVFLDDDIEVSGHEEVRRAASLLDIYDMVGMRIGGFPDNSVVCHAHRATGGAQDSFIGGGALAVETTRNPSFFPNIYNEDWFYLLDDKSLRMLAVTGEVRQRSYNPYDRPVRARDQEFGDVLAEGVYWLLDDGQSTDWQSAAHADYWIGFLDKRRAFIEEVLRNVRGLPADSELDRHAMKASLVAALGRLHRIEPEFCVAYIKAWAEDREAWRRHLDKIRRGGSDVSQAVKRLVKTGANQLNWKSLL
ncbi:hypothetical protein [Nonomuraea basaltis]|uniref:hypothetical protein n=1 Tax=Nonomuraea basaltis TaxID=2495887 RepID=UPI00110C6AC6|nr:hypothetical protein [Nonomuraea basaltis]TMR95408.1 hypothetical protein EJK15_28920 [Nonomuraea basaltis]